MITSSNRTDLFYGSQRITSRYLGSQLVWGKDLDVQSVSFEHIYFYFQPMYNFYNYTIAELQLNSSQAELVRGKNIVSVEIEGKTSDTKWAFPSSGSALNKNYLAVESTPAVFYEEQNKIKSDYGKSSPSYVDIVVYYTD